MDGTNLGILSLLPAIVFFALALTTRKCITSAVLSAVVGYALYYKGAFFGPLMDGIIEGASNADNNYIVIICVLFGCIVQLLRESKGALAVGELARKYVKSQKQVLLLTWVCGIVIFIDDYLSILVTANCVLPLADQHKTPREMLCYIINTTSAPVCLIIPISAWVVFFSGIFEQQPEAAVVGDSAMSIYYHIMPYFFYPFLCVLFVPLVIFGIIPKLGGMKKAYKRVEETGQLWSESSNMQNQLTDAGKEQAPQEENETKAHLWTFIVPMAVVIAGALILDDILYGVVLGIVSCFVLYIPTKIMTFSKFCDVCYKGVEDMLYIVVILIISVVYRNAITMVGLSGFLIEVAGPFMSSALIPVVTFILVGVVCFATGSIWSIPAICTPIILPLAASTGASIPLTLGAIISAACFGAQACFYSDVTLLSASACKINNVDYGVSQLPYIGICAALTSIGYIVAGFII